MLNRFERRLAKLSAKLQRSYVKRRHIAALFASVPHDAFILEIGGGYNPRYMKADGYPNVYHLDHGSTEVLRAKYLADPNVAHNAHRIQPIDFVYVGTAIETLVPTELKFDVIYGSHVLEHQVDLIGHLQSLGKLLKPGGRVIEMIPDLRTCFDALRYPTVTSDALLAHRRHQPTHRDKQLFDHLARVISKNHGYMMCDADFDDVAILNPLRRAVDAVVAADAPGQDYIDVHAWTFTPESFRLLMIELRLAGLVQLAPTLVSATYGNQFCAVLEHVEGDWTAMSAATQQALERERLALSIQLRFRG